MSHVSRLTSHVSQEGIIMKTLIFTLLLAVITTLNITNLRADDYSDAMVKARKKMEASADKNDKAARLKVRGDFESS